MAVTLIPQAIQGAARARQDDIPAGVQDRMLWRSAQRVLDVHQPRPSRNGQPDRCVQCGTDWPCQPSEQARRSQRISYQPCPAGITAGHDTQSRRNPMW